MKVGELETPHVLLLTVFVNVVSMGPRWTRDIHLTRFILLSASSTPDDGSPFLREDAMVASGPEMNQNSVSRQSSYRHPVIFPALVLVFVF